MFRRRAWRAVALAALTLAACLAQATEWHVMAGESIAAAIVRAAPGDTVRVAAGRFNERLVVDKPLTLLGKDRPTIAGGLEGDTVRITAPDVRVEGFIIADSGRSLEKQNAGIYVYPGAHRTSIVDCVFSYTLFGLWIEKSNDVEVRGNLITGQRDLSSSQRGNGIQLYNTIGARIVGNEISFVRDAIYVDVSHHALFRGNRMHHSRYGSHYMNSYYNVWEGNDSYHNRGGLALMEVRNQTVRNNRAWGNSDHGIMLRTIQDSVVENNVVAGNERGFFIYDAEYNVLRGNLIVDNRVGVHLSAGSTRNIVEDNDLIGNSQQIRYVGSRDEPWGGRRGNYWSNYLGWDRDGNGIGDVPYEASDLVDRLLWRIPAARLLLASPAVQTLRLIGRQFPLLRAPSVVDDHPHMKPRHADWRPWIGKHYR